MASKLISEAAAALIIEQEVSSEAAYKQKYQRPERPGGASGITIGIGYDCGYSTPSQIRSDWTGRIPANMVEVLAMRAAGLTGDAAQARLAELRPQIVVPWDAALGEFYDVEVPRWVAKVRSYLPNTEMLHPDSLGALVSLTYNRGPSFNNQGDRYTEMRAIKAAMIAKRFQDIPAQFRSMKRIWAGNPSMRGLLNRREQEAKLFERGLTAPVTAPETPRPKPPTAQPAPQPSLWDRFTSIFKGA